MNTQKIEKYVSCDQYDVHSVFFTIQGEGPYTGHPAVFIRLAGCNLQCPGCDTDYTSTRRFTTLNELVHACKAHLAHLGGRPLVVITGGEPFRQDITPLVIALVTSGFTVQVETNGTLPIPDPLIQLSENVFTVVVSPKTTKVHFTVLERANAWKYVVKAGDMGANGFPNKALGHSNAGTLATPERSFHNRGRVYMQPFDEQSDTANRANAQACVNACLTFGHSLQLQVHKIIGVE